MSFDRTQRYTAVLDFACGQVASILEQYPDRMPAHTTRGRWRASDTVIPEHSASLLAALLWKLHEFTGHPQWRRAAERYSRLLQPLADDPSAAGRGECLLLTFRPWYQLTGDQQLRKVLIAAGQRLSQLFSEPGQYLAQPTAPDRLRIETMADVPLIFAAGKKGGDGEMLRMADAHARTTRDWLVRADGSTALEAVFDVATATLQTDHTVGTGGARPVDTATESAPHTLAGQLAASLQAFSRCYTITENLEWLDVAERNADFWLTHLPLDKVPAWYFQPDAAATSPKAPAKKSLAQKDSGAAAVAASALLDLARQTRSDDRAIAYRDTALAMLDVLVSPTYLADETPDWQGILMHAADTSAMPPRLGESTMAADYYLVDALLKVLQHV